MNSRFSKFSSTLLDPAAMRDISSDAGPDDRVSNLPETSATKTSFTVRVVMFTGPSGDQMWFPRQPFLLQGTQRAVR